jgi:hypothetical protein
MSREPLPREEVVRRLFYLAHRWVSQEKATISFDADDYDTVVDAREWLLRLSPTEVPLEVLVNVHCEEGAPTVTEIVEQLRQQLGRKQG